MGTRAEHPGQLPQIPVGAHYLSKVNWLNCLPERRDVTRPWLTFDFVDPTPKFRRMGPGFNWSAPPADVPEGENPDNVLDEFVQGQTLPVTVPGYSQKFMIELINDDGNKTEEEIMFGYDDKSLCTVKVYTIIRRSDLTKEQKQLIPPTRQELSAPRTYKIHEGYRRILAGFLCEIELMTGGLQNNHNCLFRGTYLTMVLNFFARELKEVTDGSDAEWRSAALNPLLQCQLWGLQDQETAMVKLDVGMTLDEALGFYLMKDPLDPDNVKELLRNLIYVWPVRWSLGHLHKPTNHRDSYYEASHHTQHALETFTKTPNYHTNAVLFEYERQIVINEGIDHFFQFHGLIEEDQSDISGLAAEAEPH
ncbi:hypothetical protein BDM02DRAFT_3133071 [Thelephora ganbajun]|uniref:Uncharacterized protein n=1 Tax=Thelephora ganbajun TaxID=370292 RepID=A0ACB6YZ48_THEGA|nr:hypothetical protein BDM02DRAFT_3133071 [Thelephora ganbajun]